MGMLYVVQTWCDMLNCVNTQCYIEVLYQSVSTIHEKYKQYRTQADYNNQVTCH